MEATAKTNKVRKTKPTEALQRYLHGAFGDMPFKDAEHDLRVFPNAKDILEGKPQDFGGCALALACQRLYGSKAVLVMRRIAYVDVPQDDGTRVIERFALPSRTQELIKEFDTTGQASPGGYLFLAPSGSQTLDYRKKINDRRHLAGYKPKRKYSPRPDPLTLLGVRNGTGVWRLETTRVPTVRQ